MRTIIAGSRACSDYNTLLRAISDIDRIITTVISGTAQGADKLGERWAEKNNIPVERYPAFWELYGKSAGYVRNETMATRALHGALLALWDGKSKGTKHMIDLAIEYDLKVHIHLI